MHPRKINEGKRKLNILGRRIRQLREGLKVSHAEMVRRLQKRGWDIDPAVYSRLEQGQRTLTDMEIEACLAALKLLWKDLDLGQ